MGAISWAVYITNIGWNRALPKLSKVSAEDASLGPGIPEKPSAAAQPRLTNHRHKVPPDCEVRMTDVLSGLHHEYRLEKRVA